MYSLISSLMLLIRIACLIGIFAYGLVKAGPSRRPPLILAGSLMLGSVLLDLISGPVGGAVGLAMIQAMGMLSSLLTLAALLVLVLAIVSPRSDRSEPTSQQLWPGPNHGGVPGNQQAWPGGTAQPNQTWSGHPQQQPGPIQPGSNQPGPNQPAPDQPGANFPGSNQRGPNYAPPSSPPNHPDAGPGPGGPR